MAKLKVNIYWKGVWYPSGVEAPEGVPAGFTDGPMKGVAAEKSVKVSTKTTTEDKVLEPKGEDKNAAPKKRSKKSK